MAKIINKKYTLRNRATNDIVVSCGLTKQQACENVGIINHRDYLVLQIENEYEHFTFQKNLTNAQLIKILSQRDPNAKVDILVDYSTDLGGFVYGELTEDDGICYVEDTNQLVINAGEFEC